MTEENHSEQRRNNQFGYKHPDPSKGWQPGQSGNPGGRPKDTLTPLLRQFLNADNEAEKIAIIKQMISIAKSPGMRGQVAALKEIFDRIDGKVPDTHKIESDVPISIVYKQVGDRDE